MTKTERIAALEKRIEELQAEILVLMSRPAYVPVIYSNPPIYYPSYAIPYYPSTWKITWGVNTNYKDNYITSHPCT